MCPYRVRHCRQSCGRDGAPSVVCRLIDSKKLHHWIYICFSDLEFSGEYHVNYSDQIYQLQQYCTQQKHQTKNKRKAQKATDNVYLFNVLLPSECDRLCFLAMSKHYYFPNSWQCRRNLLLNNHLRICECITCKPVLDFCVSCK